jgi:PST family polysaccharide transporter
LSQVLASYFLGDTGKFWWFIIASLSLICTPLLAVELAFLQGIKQSRDLALCQVIASVVGSLITLALVYGFGLNGAILSLAPVVIVTVLVHRHFVRKYLPKNQRKPIYDFFPEFISLFKMGSAFALNGIWLTAAAMLNIIFLTKYYGPENAPLQIGLNGAATMLASVYVGIIISAMGTEFYPRLINAAGDKEKLNDLINQQTRLAIAIGVPVSTTLLLLAPWLLQFLYSTEFVKATEPMRWLIFGMIIRFITCPLGFCVYAACKPRTIAINELLAGGAMIGISYATISIYGLKGVGIGLTVANVVYMIGVAIFLHFNKIKWERRTLVTVLTAILTSVAILAILINNSSLRFFLICIGLIIILSALLFNELRKESEISWEMIRRKFLS